MKKFENYRFSIRHSDIDTKKVSFKELLETEKNEADAIKTLFEQNNVFEKMTDYFYEKYKIDVTFTEQNTTTLNNSSYVCNSEFLDNALLGEIGKIFISKSFIRVVWYYYSENDMISSTIKYVYQYNKHKGGTFNNYDMLNFFDAVKYEDSKIIYDYKNDEIFSIGEYYK